jgi:hypothetical protein
MSIATKYVIIPHEHPSVQLVDPDKHDGMKYKFTQAQTMYSRRYRKFIFLPKGFGSDGATGAKDLHGSWSWPFHDVITNSGKFNDGTPCTAWQASMILRDILHAEGHFARKYIWKWATLLLGSWTNKRKSGWF